MTVLPTKNHRPARSTNRVRTEAIRKQIPLRSELIDLRSWIDRLQPAIISANRMRRVIVTKDEENIGPLGRLGNARD